MSERKDDGGPAFPSPGYSDDGERRGMSLRDYFAGQCLVGQLAAHASQNAGSTSYDELAVDAYRMADAMLAERRK